MGVEDVQAPPLFSKIHDLSGKVALITGIGCVGEGWGNGMAIATLFARQGAILFGCDISLEAGERTKKRILNENPQADISIVRGDATSSVSMQAYVEACLAKHGRIDILVNNVGVAETGDAASTTEEVWDRQISVNLKSVYLTTHFVLPIMEKQPRGGVVVNISSISGMRYLGGSTVAYSAAKAAVLAFTKTTAVAYAKRGVRLNSVVPGLMNTPLVRDMAADYESVCRQRDAKSPTGKMGTGWDIANAVLFLASDESKYINGTKIVVDGGLTQSC